MCFSYLVEHVVLSAFSNVKFSLLALFQDSLQHLLQLFIPPDQQHDIFFLDNISSGMSVFTSASAAHSLNKAIRKKNIPSKTLQVNTRILYL